MSESMKELREAADELVEFDLTAYEHAKSRSHRNGLKLARHFLSQCDADGDEPVTGELMRSLGAKPNHWPAGTVDWDIPADDCDVIVRIWSKEIKSLPDLILSNCGDSGDFQWPIENVRHLRKVLEFLGIKTTQQPREAP